jgi:hypothetical protein
VDHGSSPDPVSLVLGPSVVRCRVTPDMEAKGNRRIVIHGEGANMTKLS